jgi:hypothetical protein
MGIRILALLVFYFSVALSAVGMLLQSIEMMAAGMLGASLGYVVRDYFSPRSNSIDPMTVYAMFFGAWMGLGHLAGYYFLGTEYEETFYGYASMDHLLEAQILATITIIVPLILYPWFRKLASSSHAMLRLPKVGFEMSDGALLNICFVLLALGWLHTLTLLSSSDYGTLGFFTSRGSEIAIFLLTWHWFGPNPTFPRWTRWLLAGAMIADVTYSLMFSYMRGEVVYPLLMFFLAIVMRKAMTKKYVVAALLLLPALAFVYHELGQLRGYGIYGTERVAKLTGQLSTEKGDDEIFGEEEGADSAMLSLIARGCLFAQLSQVARIADEEGFYKGETLEYVTYAFIPRIIWPEKPLITPGQWFAEKIGRGWRISETRFSNSINMTLAGEFYLNFGWAGSVAGIVLMTFLYTILWETTGFYDLKNNPLGQGLGIAILFQATVSSSAAGILNLIFSYLATLALAYAFISLAKRRKNRAQWLLGGKSSASRKTPYPGAQTAIKPRRL